MLARISNVQLCVSVWQPGLAQAAKKLNAVMAYKADSQIPTIPQWLARSWPETAKQAIQANIETTSACGVANLFTAYETGYESCSLRKQPVAS